MLRVSTDAWHYRLYTFIWDDDIAPKNLCHYFWHLLLGVLLLPFVLLGRFVNWIGAGKWLSHVVIGGVGIYGMVMMVFAVMDNWWNLLLIPAAVASVLVFIIGVTTVIWVIIKWRRKKSRVVSADSTSALVKEYVKAKKRRVCPLIEVVGPEDVP